MSILSLNSSLLISYILVNGNWASWGSYEPCSESCGGGQKRRERSCTNPAPKYNGTDCQGSSVQTKSCNTKACPSILISF